MICLKLIIIFSVIKHTFVLGIIFSGFLGNKVKENTIFIKLLDKTYYLPYFIIEFLLLLLMLMLLMCYFNYATTPMFKNNFNSSIFHPVDNIPATKDTGSAILNQTVGFAYPSQGKDIWHIDFINAPLESLDPTIMEILNTTLLLTFIMTYFIFMSIVFFTSKLIIASNINVDKLPLSKYIHKYLGKLVTLTNKSINL